MQVAAIMLGCLRQWRHRVTESAVKDLVIDRGLRVPPYVQIRDLLISKIQSGEFRRGERLPISSELRAHFSVSHHTLNRAIQDLKREGWVTARTGSGVFVATTPVEDADNSARPRSKELNVPDLAWMGEKRAVLFNELQQLVPGVRVNDGAQRLDVCSVHGPMLPCVAHELADLTDVFLPAWGRSAEDPIVAPFCHEGKLRVVSSAPIVGAVMINEALFSEAGVAVPGESWTLPDMIEIARRLHAPERGRYGIAMFANYLDFMYFLGHANATFFDAAGLTCRIDSPEALAAMERMSELARCGPPGGVVDRMAAFREGRTGMLIGYPGTLAKAHRCLLAPHRLLPLPDYRRGIVPLDGEGMAMRIGAQWPEAAVQFLRLFLKGKLSVHEPRTVPLCVDSACEDRSPLMRPLRESLGYGRTILWNVPPTARTMRHDLALQVFDAQCESIALGAPAQRAERMGTLAGSMGRLIDGRRLTEHL